jgi:hypothetical protein
MSGDPAVSLSQVRYGGITLPIIRFFVSYLPEIEMIEQAHELGQVDIRCLLVTANEQHVLIITG